ncbi:initiation factor 2 [Hypoxylon sp. NC1633]|nr:initiation factor 2 [Hypoxylon sp. NC1633]
MLRVIVLKRDTTSICALCQHRLSLRLTTPRKRRQFSSTRKLGDNDGWGSWGSSAKPAAPSNQGDFLSQHEALARQRLLERQQANQVSKPPIPKSDDNGLQARYVWDAGKQREVEESLRRDGVTFQRDATPSRRRDPADGAADLQPRLSTDGARSMLDRTYRGQQNDSQGLNPPRRSLLGDMRNDTPPTNLRRSDNAFRPSDNTLRQSNNALRPSDNGFRSSRGRDMFSRELPDRSNTSPTQQNSAIKPGDTFGSQFDFRRTDRNREPTPPFTLKDNSVSSPPSKSDSDWGLLARKKPPGVSNSDEFWGALNNNANGFAKAESQRQDTPARPTEHSGAKDPWSTVDQKIRGERRRSAFNASDDWGKEFDNREFQRTRQPSTAEGFDRPAQASYGWGNGFDNDDFRRKTQPLTEEDPSRPVQASSRVVQEIPGQDAQKRVKGRDRERGRNKRAERSEAGERGGGSRGKRSRPGSRSEEDEEEGFDYDKYEEKRRLKAQRKAEQEAFGAIPIRLPELIGIPALAKALKVEENKFLGQLSELGFEDVTLDSLMAGETAALVAQEYGFEPIVESGDHDLKPRPPPEDPSILPPRPPVVTIMGHVDHGKTTLLDYLRKSSIAAQEHGGITQRIGAFSVKMSSGKTITFLDTPGHAAFLAMRQRGAQATDIVILVVAADDSVKPQTIEAIKHARAAKVPIIVAINKIDKDGARIDQVKSDLSNEGVEIEDFGGDVQVVCVSGKTGQGMDDLEENILTLSEILDHRAEVDGPAEGWILESSLKPIGKAATVLVKRGTLRLGDFIAADLTWAKIRHLRNEAGVEIDEAPPGTPVEILGWKDLPGAGDRIIQAPDESRAKLAVEYREGLRDREKDAAAQVVISEARLALQEKRAREKAAAKAEKVGAAAAAAEPLVEEENGTKLVNLVVKGDLHGSVEAVCAAILELGNHEVRPRILRSVTGPISEFDVEHAATTSSIIVNFATTIPGYVKHKAEEQGVRILDHTVIYHLVDDIKATLSSYLAPELSSRVLGEAEVLQIFPINIKGRKYKNIAGCRVRNGLVARTGKYRIFRGGEKIFDGKIETLKHLKKDVTEVHKGTECGIGFEEFQDFSVGDRIQAYEEIKTERSL